MNFSLTKERMNRHSVFQMNYRRNETCMDGLALMQSRKYLDKQMSLMVFRSGYPFVGTRSIRDTLVGIV